MPAVERAAEIARLERNMELDRLPLREAGSRRVNVVIDTPAGSRNKYRYDAQYAIYRLSRVLPHGSTFPYDFGSVPRTRSADGDPLDVMVLGAAPSFCGCLMSVRLIGVIHARQLEAGRVVRNDRLIGIAATKVNRAHVRELRELDVALLADLEHFFESYNRRQGRAFRITGRGGRAAAEAVLARAARAFAGRRN
jgi:inorganic pyrophosphatase